MRPADIAHRLRGGQQARRWQFALHEAASVVAISLVASVLLIALATAAIGIAHSDAAVAMLAELRGSLR